MAALSSVRHVKKADDPLVSSCVDGVKGRGQEMTWGNDLPFSNIQAETIPGMHWSVQVASVGSSSVPCLPAHKAYFKLKSLFELIADFLVGSEETFAHQVFVPSDQRLP